MVCYLNSAFLAIELKFFNDLFGLSPYSSALFIVFSLDRSKRSFSSTPYNDGEFLLSNVQWHELDENGFLKDSDESLDNLAGVYAYQSVIDPEKIYIGSTYDLYTRFNQHRALVISRSTNCPKFYNYVRKYGWNSIRFGVLKYIDLEQHSGAEIQEIRKIITDREQEYFNLYSPTLNVNPSANSRLGAKHSEITRKKLSEANIGKVMSEETRKKISGSNHYLFGKSPSKEALKNMSLAKLGKFLGENHPSFGKIHTEEAKEKMSQVKLGSTHSEETKEKMSRAKGTTIYVYNLKYELLYTFTSATKAELHFKSKTHTILKYARSGEIFRKENILSLEVIKASSE